jgi:chaperonin GroES
MIKPMHDRILVKPLNPETKTKSGLVIPDNALEKPSRGVVVKIGNGRLLNNGTLVPLTVQENDTILYAKHSGISVKVEEEDYLVLREDEVLGIFE